MAMEKFITKRLEKFVSDVQNPIFADRFREKVSAFNDQAGKYSLKAVMGVVRTYRKTCKYVYGKERVKRFLIGNINSFEQDHNEIVNLIESGDVKENWEKYTGCKSRISAILRANRRLNSLKVTNNETVTSYLNEYINRRRFEKKYELT